MKSKDEFSNSEVQRAWAKWRKPYKRKLRKLKANPFVKKFMEDLVKNLGGKVRWKKT